MMESINIITGIRYRPETFLAHMRRSKKLAHIECTCVGELYSPCWVFQFRVALYVNRRTTRYAGYYAGFEESTMTPGKLAILPGYHEGTVDESRVLPHKLTQQQALEEAWEYNKLGILRKFKSLNAPPQLEDYKAECLYKPMYLIRFYHKDLREERFKVLDSLSGDLEDIAFA